MALPATFQNSFWTADFKLDGLWPKLRAGVVENQEILRLVSDRADAANETAKALYSISETKLKSNGFALGDGASLRRTFEGLKDESAQVAKAHEQVATNLDHMIIRPFGTWSHAHDERVSALKEHLDQATKDWEQTSAEARRLKDVRNQKCSLLDEAEDDLRFAPASPSTAVASSSNPRGRSDSATSTGSGYGPLRWDPHQAAQAAQQASTVASNLARGLSQRMKASPTASAVKTRFERMRAEARERELASRGIEAGTGTQASALLEKEELLDEEGKELPDKDRKSVADAVLQPSAEIVESNPVQVDQLEIAGVVKHPKDWSIIFAKAKTQVPTTAVKVPLIGTTPDAQSGEDLVIWFRENLEDLGNSFSRSHEFCRQLSEELAILRLVGEIGNKFFDSSDAFYAWRPEAFHLDNLQDQINGTSRLGSSGATDEQDAHLTEIPALLKERRLPTSPHLNSPKLHPQSPPTVPAKDQDSGISNLASPGSAATSPNQTSNLSRSNTISSYLTTAYEKAANNVSSLNARVAKAAAGSGPAGERFSKLSKDAVDAEETYRVAVRDLEDARLRLEQEFSSTLARAQKLEHDRLKAIKSVLTTYNATLASLNTPLQLSSERSALLSEAFQPISDINSVIEQYKTGPFRPKATVWTDFYHETTDARFGIDLRHWQDMNLEKGKSAGEREKLPDVFAHLLQVLEQGYPGLQSDEERRKTWIYEVPLPFTHRLRNTLNVAGQPMAELDLAKIDLPVIASCLKLYLLELAVPLIPTSLYSDVKAIYPSVGAATTENDTRIASLLAILERTPKIHLTVLDALLAHLRRLIDQTQDESNGETSEKTDSSNSDNAFITKLGATLGPCILRPAVDNSLTLNDRFPIQLFCDLLKDYGRLLPPTLKKKAKVEEERYAPKRQRTKMVDQRVTRSVTSSKENRKHSDWLKEELERKMGHKIMEEPEEDGNKPSLRVVPGTAEQTSLEGSTPSAAVENRDGSNVATSSNVNAPSAVPEAEELQIPAPAPEAARSLSPSGDDRTDPGSKTPGFVTPTEELPSAPLSRSASANPHPVDSASQPAAGLDQAAPPSQPTNAEAHVPSEEYNEDIPLSTGTGTGGLLRSSTGSSAKRVPPSGISRSGATRGPRPMSMHGPSSSGTAGTSTVSPAASPSAGGIAGVRARAAVFEQRGGSKDKDALSPKSPTA